MNAYLMSRLLRNGFWLLMALACALPLARMIAGGDPEVSLAGAALLCSAVLISGLIVDAMSHENPSLSFWRASLLVMLVASTMLLVVALSHTLRVPPAGFVLQVLLLFALFRWLFTSAATLTWPSWLSNRVLLLGNGAPAEKARAIIRDSGGRFVLTRHIPESSDLDHAQDCDHLAAMAIADGVKTVVVSFPDRRGSMPLTKLLRCRMQGIKVIDVPTFYEKASRKLYLENTTPAWFIFSSGFCHSLPRRAFKRALDVVGASFGLLLLAPILPLIALAIRLDSPGPALFRQIRTGRGGQPFTIIKFRTMRLDAEQGTGAVWASKQDPRVTRLGHFLRQTRLDETPQLFNVVMGQMSLVGPRPERPEFIRDLERDIPFYAERHCVKPGVTGWAQVRYPYGASIVDSLEKLRYDLYYIKNQSFWLDTEIILRTVAVVLLRCGAR